MDESSQKLQHGRQKEASSAGFVFMFCDFERLKAFKRPHRTFFYVWSVMLVGLHFVCVHENHKNRPIFIYLVIFLHFQIIWMVKSSFVGWKVFEDLLEHFKTTRIISKIHFSLFRRHLETKTDYSFHQRPVLKSELSIISCRFHQSS